MSYLLALDGGGTKTDMLLLNEEGGIVNSFVGGGCNPNRSSDKALEVAAAEAFSLAGIREPLKELDVCELYLPYSFAGLKWMESIGFCRPGEAPRLLWDGETDMEGTMPVNPSGGVLATNCIGATGLLRVGEVAHQIMGRADKRQVDGARLGMATGFGGCFWSDVLIIGSQKP